jgi:hypothetical protein
MCTGIASLLASKQLTDADFTRKPCFVSEEDLDKWDSAGACHLGRKTSMPFDSPVPVLAFDFTDNEHTDAVEADVKCKTGVPVDK